MITSADNKQVKEIIKLNQKKRERDREGVFIIEGSRLFSEAPVDRIVKVYVSEDYRDETGKLSQLTDITETVSSEVFKKMTDTLTPQGILCVMNQEKYSLREELGKITKKPLVMVLEGVQDPGNLGTIMRTAEGAGADIIVMSSDTVDIYNPKTVRSTMGSIFRVPFVYTEDLKGAIDEIKGRGISCYAAHLKGKKSFRDIDYSKGACFFIGNEGNGLTDETAALADEYIIIPMKGQLESLNAAVSAALLMYAAQ